MMNQTKVHDSKGRLQEYLGADLLALSQKRRHLCVPLPQGGHYILFQCCPRSLSTAHGERVQLICSHDQFILLSGSKDCREIASALDAEADGYSQFHQFCKGLLDGDVDELIAIENHISAFEDALLISRKEMRTATQTIVTMRRSLLSVKRYYQQLQRITIQLSDEDAGLSSALMRKFELLSNRLAQLIETVQVLQEAVTQCGDTYQAQIGIQQNKLMKIFTVITIIFMPLTVVVGWYGMNFDGMPELHWRYGYLYVIALSVVVCTICALIFKWKKWFD